MPEPKKFEELVKVILENMGYMGIRRDPQVTGMEFDNQFKF